MCDGLNTNKTNSFHRTRSDLMRKKLDFSEVEEMTVIPSSHIKQQQQSTEFDECETEMAHSHERNEVINVEEQEAVNVF